MRRENLCHDVGMTNAAKVHYRWFDEETLVEVMAIDSPALAGAYRVVVTQGNFPTDLSRDGFFTIDRAIAYIQQYIVEPVEAAKAMLAAATEAVKAPEADTTCQHSTDAPCHCAVACEAGISPECMGVGNRRTNPIAKLEGSNAPRYTRQCLNCHEALAVTYVMVSHGKVMTWQ